MPFLAALAVIFLSPRAPPGELCRFFSELIANEAPFFHDFEMDSLKNGVQNPAVIDLVAHDPSCDEVVLGMYEEREWDGSEDRLFELQEKFNTYLSFALDGEMAESYPQYLGKKVRVQLNCFYSPDPTVFAFLDQVKEALPQGINFAVCIPDPSQSPGECGSGSCGCKE